MEMGDAANSASPIFLCWRMFRVKRHAFALSVRASSRYLPRSSSTVSASPAPPSASGRSR